MPTIDHKYKTSYAFAQDLVQLYAPLTQRCLLPSYRKPDKYPTKSFLTQC